MSNSKTENFEIAVSHADSGKRLDVFLVSSMSEFTRARIQKLIRAGNVLVNQSASKASAPIKEGDVISVEIPPAEMHDIIPEKIPLHVIFEDEDIIIVNKPAGMVVHPAAGNWKGTLANALMAHCGGLSQIGGEIKPGIVHRLDKGTSGVMVAAKNDKSHLSLSKQFKDREVKKIYTALVFGTFKQDKGVIEAAIGRSVKDRKKYSTVTRKGREAVTEWQVVRRFDKDLTLLEIRLRTGRTHQIRVHFASSGHPLLGDETYGGTQKRLKVLPAARRKKVDNFSRPALHATVLGFRHPASGEWMEFRAPLPPDFEELLKNL